MERLSTNRNPNYSNHQGRARVRMQEGSMTNQLQPKYKGLIQWCEHGRLLYDTYYDIVNDDNHDPFDEAWVFAFNAWKEHRDSCDKCGYI